MSSYKDNDKFVNFVMAADNVAREYYERHAYVLITSMFNAFCLLTV